MRLELDGLEVRADEWSERCATAIDNASGYVVVLSSVLESRAVTLVSCYLADLAGPTAVSHLRLAPGQPPRVAQRVLDGLPVQSHARACLLEDEEVSVELAEETLAQAARVWAQEHD